MSAAQLRDCHPFRSVEAAEHYLSHYDVLAESWPLASENRIVHTECGQTFVRISGPTDAPPLVLLPGLWSTSLMWSPVIEALSEGLRTYAVDSITDFGRSVSTRPIKGVAGHMEWLDGLFDALGLSDGINLLGCSRGGLQTAEYALHAPHRLAKVVWLSPALVVHGPAASSFLPGLRFPVAVLMPSRSTVGPLIHWLMPDAAKPDGRAHDFTERSIDHMVLGLQCYSKAPLSSGRVFGKAELGGIEVPVLYLAGEHERMYSARAAVSRLNSVAPQIETAIIPGVGHDLPAGQPEAFTETVLEFLGA